MMSSALYMNFTSNECKKTKRIIDTLKLVNQTVVVFYYRSSTDLITLLNDHYHKEALEGCKFSKKQSVQNALISQIMMYLCTNFETL